MTTKTCNWMLCLALLFGSTAIAGCSKDDDDDNGNGGAITADGNGGSNSGSQTVPSGAPASISGIRIASVNSNSLSYDTEGRVAQFGGYSVQYSPEVKFYRYGACAYNKFSFSKDGYITSFSVDAATHNTPSYTDSQKMWYNSRGHLTQFEMKLKDNYGSEHLVAQLDWNGDRLNSVRCSDEVQELEDGETYVIKENLTVTYSYGNTNNAGRFDIVGVWEEFGEPNLLAYTGLLGVWYDLLPTKAYCEDICVEYCNGKLEESDQIKETSVYTYTFNDDGTVAKVLCNWKDTDNDSGSHTTTFAYTHHTRSALYPALERAGAEKRPARQRLLHRFLTKHTNKQK